MSSNWQHVSSDLARSLLEGRAPADKMNLSIVLDNMLEEQKRDASNPMIPEEIWWGRDDAMDWANRYYRTGLFGLCMNQIKTFYLT